MVALAALSLALVSLAPSVRAPAPAGAGPGDELGVAVPVGDAVAWSELIDRWESARASLGLPGLAVVVVKDGRVELMATFGSADPEGTRPVTVDTAFYIASATKPFVAAALCLYADEGRVDLDAPVKRYLPRFELADPAAAESITVRDLLCHRPGLNAFPVVFLDAYSGEITEDRYFRFLKDATPRGETDYSNVHFTLAGRVLEAVAGKPWRDVLAERIFRPADMRTATGYADEMYARDDVAIPSIYSPDGVVAAPVRKTDRTMHAAGGLGTSIRDLSRWLLLFLGGGEIDGERLLSEEMHADMLRQHSAHPEPRGEVRREEGFGLGWWYGTYRGRPYRHHGGGYVGAAAHVSFLPEHGVGVAIVANHGPAGNALGQVISIDVYDRLLDISPREDFLGGFAGRARQARTRAETSRRAVVNAADGALSLDPADYDAVYSNADWGTLDLAYVEGRFVGRMGDLDPSIEDAEGEDRFEAYITDGMSAPGRFVVEDGEVVAVLLALRDDDVFERFERE